MSVWREGRHWQYDGRWFAMWFGLSAHLMVGVVFNRADGPALGIGLGPFYAGIGGYDR